MYKIVQKPSFLFKAMHFPAMVYLMFVQQLNLKKWFGTVKIDSTDAT